MPPLCFPLSKHSFDPAAAACPAPEPSAVGGGSRAAAFTLIELLVAMTVTMILVVGLMQIFNATANTWQHGEAQVDAYREARGALQFMARDLSATLQASYAQTNGALTTNTPSFSPAMPTFALQHGSASYASDGGPVNEEVYCLTNTTNSGASSLCTVGYYCQWMPDIRPTIHNCPQAYALMRQFSDSNATFLHIKTAGINPLTFDNLFAQTTTPAPSVTQLAAYVWDLRFRIDTDLNDSTQGFPDGNAPTAPADHTTPNPRYYRGDAASQPYPPRLPAYVEIRFKALSDIAGRRLEGTGSGVGKATWNDSAGFPPTALYRSIIQPNAQQFVLRVPLINATPLPTP